MLQKTPKRLGMSPRQKHDVSKQRIVENVLDFSLTKFRPRNASTFTQPRGVLNLLRKLKDFLNNTRDLEELVTIHGGKKWL